ncbi:MAG: hypothetical protein HQL51_12870, partial [Magnetococcales bacterium]|nr:hypothetical protein [Magnetococcales bacterium]
NGSGGSRCGSGGSDGSDGSGGSRCGSGGSRCGSGGSGGSRCGSGGQVIPLFQNRVDGNADSIGSILVCSSSNRGRKRSLSRPASFNGSTGEEASPRPKAIKLSTQSPT